MNKENKEMLERVKMKISISNFYKEEKIVMNKNKKNILKPVAIASLAVIFMSSVAFATKTFVKDFFGPISSDGVDIAVNNGYVSDVKTEYQEADGIEISIDSVLMDDFNFCMNFNMRLSEKYNIDDFKRTYFHDIKIVDETGKIVFNGMNCKLSEEELKKSYMGAHSMLATKINDNELKVSLTATGNPENFPRSKKLYINFSEIEITQDIEKDKRITYTGNWNFEVDVPEEFYNRETIIYKVKSCTEEGININDVTATLSQTGFKISIPEIKTDKVDYKALHSSNPKSIYDIIALQKEYVETSDGKKFETAQRSDGDGGYGLPNDGDRIINYYQTFNLTSYDATDEITVHIFTNKKEEIKIVFSQK